MSPSEEMEVGQPRTKRRMEAIPPVSQDEDESLFFSYSDSEDEFDSDDDGSERANVITSKKRRCSVSPSEEMELGQPRTKRSRIPLVNAFAPQLIAGIEAIPPVSTHSVEHPSSQDGLLSSNDPPDNVFKSVEDNEEVDLAILPASTNSVEHSSSQDEVEESLVLGLNDDQMDTSSDLTPTLSIPAGEAREVPPRETSTKGRRLLKELESSLDGHYWTVMVARR